MKFIKSCWFWLFVLIVINIVATKSYQTFFYRPCSVHHWRQSDGASYALNYYQNKGPFLPSQVHHRHAENGYAVSELPIVYFIASKLYNVFGFHDYYVRLLHFALFILGLIYITRITKLFTSNVFLQLFPAAFALTSPYLYYYSANFLPDVAALSLAFVGFYYFLQFTRNRNVWLLVFSFALYTLAGTLKVSGAILMVCSIAYLVLEWVHNSDGLRQLSRAKKVTIFLTLVIAAALSYGWIAYDKYVAEKYHFGGNLFGFYGIWDADLQTIKYISGRIITMWVKVIFSKYLWLITFLCAGLIVFRFKQMHKTLRFFSVLSFIGVFLFVICWFRTFDVHDYYMINLFCLPLLLFITSIQYVAQEKWLANKKVNLLAGAILLLLFVHSTLKNAGEQYDRYNAPIHNNFNKSYYNIEPYLRSLGIKPTDMVVSVPDPSPNITLYLMNQIGYTEAYTGGDYNIYYFKNNAKAKYLIVGDSTYLSNPLYQPFCNPEKQIGKFEGIHIFNLQ